MKKALIILISFLMILSGCRGKAKESKATPAPTVQIQLPTAPEKRERMTAIVYQGVENMVNNGPKAEDLQKVKEYMLRSHEESLKQNGYWMSEMMNYVLYGEDNDAIYVDTVNGITAADIQEMARQIFKSGNRIEVGMTSPMEDVIQNQDQNE